MRTAAIKGFVFNVIKSTENIQFPSGCSFVVLGVNSGMVLALTSEENIVLFPADILNDTERFDLVGTFSSGEIEDVFKPLIKRMRTGNYSSFGARI